MILLRCLYRGRSYTGVLQGGQIHVVEGDPAHPQPGRLLASLEQVRLLPPSQPSKILAVGRNYADHAAEFDHLPPAEPLLFLKPPSALIGPDDPIHLPAFSERVDHEAELALVIGRRCRHVSPEQALSCVLGYTCANDVTARDLQRGDGQWTRGKGFDTFCPLGPWLVTDLDPAQLQVMGRVNGELRQHGHVRDLVFSVGQLIAYAAAVMTLEPGDVLLTGTPAGVGPLQPGDLVEVEIPQIGVLRNPVLTAVPRPAIE
ncbi:MAG: fumarylacetoacetate hydrolase family protein [Chloroflexia bacterium]|nr:fumarylacetoacetate hydrolase family protein [Chloroflexia bacterium]